jgi:hypothetical protein
MKKGWFIGNFPRVVYKTKVFEIAIRMEKAGECVQRHLHKVATEITAVVKGHVFINGKKFKQGDIIVIRPYETADYEVSKDAITVVMKIPSVKNDKYFI